MLFSAIFPLVLSIGSFVLTMLVLLAGRNTSTLDNVYVLKIKTDRIATQTDLNGLLRQYGVNPNNTGIKALDSAIASLDSEQLGRVLNTAAHELGLHDFYTAHTLTWCEGVKYGDNNDTATDRVTQCTKPAIPFSFDPIKIIESELLQNMTLEQIGLQDTSSIESTITALETAYRAMSILYLIGIIFAGILILESAAAFFVGSRVLALLGGCTAIVAIICLGVASAISTVLATKVKDIINDKGSAINISAENSPEYLGMTWAAVAAAIAVFVWWAGRCCCGGGRRNRRDAEKAYT